VALHKAIRLSQTAGDAVHHSLSLSAMGLVENWKGDYERAAKLQTEALAIARERNLLVPLLFNFFLRGLTLTAKGEYDDAFLLFREGLALSEQVGDEAIHHRLLNCLGWLYSEIGDFDRARILNEESAQVGRSFSVINTTTRKHGCESQCTRLFQLVFGSKPNLLRAIPKADLGLPSTCTPIPQLP
jgi:tetratricopeptide (TPR) repeat protein